MLRKNVFQLFQIYTTAFELTTFRSKITLTTTAPRKLLKMWIKFNIYQSQRLRVAVKQIFNSTSLMGLRQLSLEIFDRKLLWSEMIPQRWMTGGKWQADKGFAEYSGMLIDIQMWQVAGMELRNRRNRLRTNLSGREDFDRDRARSNDGTLITKMRRGSEMCNVHPSLSSLSLSLFIIFTLFLSLFFVLLIFPHRLFQPLPLFSTLFFLLFLISGKKT